MHPTVRNMITLGAMLLLAGLPGTGAAERPPNIIWIMADDLGYGDLGCYGQETLRTPNIDRLAAEGMRFTQAYAGSTVCAPSRSVLMTGLHTGHCDVRGNKLVPLKDETVTVAEVLRDAGYATAMFGKWGLGEPGTTGLPNRQGFDTWFGYLNQKNAHNFYPEYLWSNEEKFPLPENADGAAGRYTHDLFTERALDWLEERAAGEAGQAHPFFLYLPYTVPHANNELGAATGDGMEVPDYGPYADRDWPAPEKGFAAMVHRLDRDVARIIAALKAHEIDDSTIVFFTSDNGPHHEGGHSDTFFKSSGPLRGSKRDLYDGGIRVPMIVRWPGRIPSGTVSDYVWSFADFLPTAAELAGAACPAGLDGISILSELTGGGADRTPRFLYWEFHERGFTQGVRYGPWKAFRDNGAPLELYNVESDAAEAVDVAAEHPEVVARIEEWLKTARTESEEFPVRLRRKN